MGFGPLPELSGCLSVSPPRAFRVMSSARGKRLARKGPSGVERRVAHNDPIVVRVVRRMVAYKGENRAPPRTFLGIKRFILRFIRPRLVLSEKTYP